MDKSDVTKIVNLYEEIMFAEASKGNFPSKEEIINKIIIIINESRS